MPTLELSIGIAFICDGDGDEECKREAEWLYPGGILKCDVHQIVP